MATVVAARLSWLPWPERLFGRLPVSPIWVGLAIGLFTLAVLVAGGILGGDLHALAESERGILQERDARFAVVLCALVGFLPASQQYIVRVTQGNLDELAPLLGRPVKPLELSRPSFWACILPGILLAPLIGYGIDRDLSFYLQPDYLRQPVHWFQWAVGFFCTINIALSAHVTLTCASELEKRADSMPRIDLLDLSQLSPFGRQSLQILLVSLVGLSIFSVNAGDPDFFLPLLLFATSSLSVAGVAALRCNRTIHRRIQQAKRDEMMRVNDALRGNAEAQSALAICASEEGRSFSTGDLLAYRRFVEELREWALDTSAWLRSVLYLAIPMGSWLGGALVERGLEAALR